MQIFRFTAPWCMPCKAMQPVVDWARNEGYDITDIDLDGNTSLAMSYNITSVPTFIVLDNGNEVRRQTGAMTKKQFAKFLEG